MAGFGETTITIPGTGVKVPSWGLIAGAGGLAAVLLLRPKGGQTQGNFNDQGTVNQGGDAVSLISDLLKQLQNDMGPGGLDVSPTPDPGGTPSKKGSKPDQGSTLSDNTVSQPLDLVQPTDVQGLDAATQQWLALSQLVRGNERLSPPTSGGAISSGQAPIETHPTNIPTDAVSLTSGIGGGAFDRQLSRLAPGITTVTQPFVTGGGGGGGASGFGGGSAAGGGGASGFGGGGKSSKQKTSKPAPTPSTTVSGGGGTQIQSKALSRG